MHEITKRQVDSLLIDDAWPAQDVSHESMRSAVTDRLYGVLDGIRGRSPDHVDYHDGM